MSYPFPPPPPFNMPAFVVSAVLLIVVVLSMAGMSLTWKGGHPISVAILIAIALGAVMISSRKEYQSFTALCMAFTALLAGTGFVRCWRNFQRQEKVSAGWFVGVVLLVLAQLAMVNLPPVASAREAARRTQCRNNLKQIGVVMHNWRDEHDQLPDTTTSINGGPPVSWRVTLLDQLSSRQSVPFDTQQPWDSAANLEAAQRKISAFSCPSNIYPIDDSGRHYTAYAVMSGIDSAFPNGKGLPLSDPPMSSSTLLAVEACGQNIVWTEPRDVITTEQMAGVNLPGKKLLSSTGWLSSYHAGGTHVGLVDGSVRFLSEKIAPEVLRSLITPDEKDNPTEPW